MKPSDLNSLVLAPAMALLPGKMDTPAARIIQTAIGLQESALQFRQQLHGPAHGLWQFELEGVRGVMTHTACQALAEAAAEVRGCEITPEAVYAAIVTDDVLAAVIARLLLWSDPAPLPALGNLSGAWDYYMRNWRPGKPRPNVWAWNYSLAEGILK